MAVKKETGEFNELVLHRAKQGDSKAFEQLVHRYHLSVYQLLWRMLERSSRQARVEDLVQETFLRVFRCLGNFRLSGPAKLSTWILTIATHLALNELRKKRKMVSFEDSADYCLSSDRPDEALKKRRIGLAIRDAISKLSPDHRAVFILREYHDCEYAEIAEALNIDLGTVKSRLSRARGALRESLKEVRNDHR
ncbi:MAG: sigma-70 family RNA polymerase sigma factor [Proteobacteria bacterium]|nr:sigma-70 family RNA polymerase sigma factor [Pseudomonadota bacterium]